MRRTSTVAGLWLALTLASTVAAWACSCAVRDPRSALGDAEAAIVGTLVDSDEMTPVDGVLFGGQVVGYHFTVERWVKGDGPTTLTVHSAFDGAACGIEAAPGQRIGLLLRHDEQGRWRSGLCSQFDPDDLLDAARFPVVPAAAATGLLAVVAEAARRSVRRSGLTAAHGTLR